MSDDDIEYFLHRAEVEFEAAQRATAPEVAATHQGLAEAYLKRVAELSPSGDWLEPARAEKTVLGGHGKDEPTGSAVLGRGPAVP